MMSGQLIRRALSAGVLASLCVAAPAQAVMGCWNETQVAAAKVRDLQSRLMVATLRCSAMGVNVAPAYNRFVTSNRSTIQSANGVILAQFRAGVGSAAQVHYDRFATALANIYGDDATNQTVCAETAMLADEAANARGDLGQLVAIADRFGRAPELPGGRCTLSFAGGQ